MRIAGRRPLLASTLAPSLRLLPALFAMLALVIVAVVLIAARTDPGSQAAPTAPLSMADALGVGGLPAMTLDDPSAPGDVSPLTNNVFVAYYGSPRQPDMGILGEYDPDTVAWMLSDRAARFDALNGDSGVLPVLHLVYGVAQPETGADGLYLRYVDDRTVRQYLDVARRYGFALVLDLQIGHSSALAEVRKILPYLEEPDVHVALDPEFALAGRSRPGQAIGTIDASDINAVQTMLAGFTEERGLPRKALIVHQFSDSMISNTASIERSAGVDLIIDMDGYGTADVKRAKYRHYADAPNVAYGGIKLFLHHDPDLMSEEQLLELDPPAAFFLYQ